MKKNLGLLVTGALLFGAVMVITKSMKDAKKLENQINDLSNKIKEDSENIDNYMKELRL